MQGGSLSVPLPVSLPVSLPLPEPVPEQERMKQPLALAVLVLPWLDSLFVFD